MVAALCIASALIGSGAASATAAVAPEATEIYVAGSTENAIAFKVEGDQVSVLAIAATMYCSNTEPIEEGEATVFGLLAAPLPMRATESDLTAHERGVGQFGWRRIGVEAAFSGEKLVGRFNVVQGEGTGRCQTGNYFGSSGTRVPFEATRFVPVGSPSAIPNGFDTAPVYFGINGKIEVFFASDGRHVVTRGASVSRCPVDGSAASRRSLFGESPVANKLGERGKFERRSTYRPWAVLSQRENGWMTGDVSARAVTGTYQRETVLHPLTTMVGRCTDAPIRFRARRYVPAVS